MADLVPPRFDFHPFSSEQYSYVKTSLSDEKIVESIFEEFEIDAVIHMVSSIIPASSFQDLILASATNFIPSLKLIELMRNHHVKRLVFFSTGGAMYGRSDERASVESDEAVPLNYYGWMKESFEEYIKLNARLWGLEFLILRPSNPYGKYQNPLNPQGLITTIFHKIMTNDKLEIWGDGTVVRDYIHIKDLCSSVIKLIQLSTWNEIYNISSGVGTAVKDVIDLAMNISAKSIGVIYKSNRKIDAPCSVLDNTKLCSAIEFNPMALEQGMRLYWSELSK